jgi:hypothetical protein
MYSLKTIRGLAVLITTLNSLYTDKMNVRIDIATIIFQYFLYGIYITPSSEEYKSKY